MREISHVSEFGSETGKPIREMISNNVIPKKEKILKYLKSFEPDCAAGMSLVDEITGDVINSGVLGYEDGVFYWDTREIYHFDKYNLELDTDFVKHILDN